MLRRLAVATAVSEEAAAPGRRSRSATECEILPNGVDVDRFADGRRVRPSTRRRSSSSAATSRRKGLEVLLDAFAGLDRDAELWVAGDGPQTRRAARPRRRPASSGSGGSPTTRRQARLRGATIACFPAIDGESFGVVLLEAMAAGTALVASDIDGYRDVARADREARAGPARRRRRAPRRASRTSSTTPARRAALVAAGRARADEFSMAASPSAFLALYERAIARRAQPESRRRAGAV